MSIASIISAIGNNSSTYPLLLRDCGIEVPAKVVLTYNQNKKDKEVAKLAARERLLDEYATSAVWLGGIPLLDKIANKIISKKGFNPSVNPKLFEEEKLQGLQYNIQKFKDKAPEAVKDLLKLSKKEAQKSYNGMLSLKIMFSTLIPIAFMGFILPKMIFASSAKRIAKLKQERTLKNQPMTEPVMYPAFTAAKRDFFERYEVIPKGQNISFSGFSAAKLSTVSTQDKMMITDGGYTIGRIATARKKNEALDVGFRLSGMMFLNFVAPKWIEKGLNKLTGAALDPLMLADGEFLKAAKNGTVKLPENNKPETLLQFVDNNTDSLFVKFANKLNKVALLKNGVRDPRAYVDFEKLGKFRDDVEDYLRKAGTAKSFEKYAKKAKILKSVDILANVGISSFLLAYCLPKLTFAFRKLVTGSELEPGLAPDVQAAKS